MASAANILQRQFKGNLVQISSFEAKHLITYVINEIELSRNPVPGFAVDLKEDNIFEW
jgi:hypothetical protein